MSDKTFNGEQKLKLTQIINEGMQVTHEIETLQGGLNDTIKAIAEELEIKPAVLKKAIRLAHKAEFGREKQDHELLETILETVGKTRPGEAFEPAGIGFAEAGQHVQQACLAAAGGAEDGADRRRKEVCAYAIQDLKGAIGEPDLFSPVIHTLSPEFFPLTTRTRSPRAYSLIPQRSTVAIAQAKTPGVSKDRRWSCRPVPKACFGWARTSPATTTFQQSPRAFFAPERIWALAAGNRSLRS